MTKQFWALFKFQTTINPALWFMPLAFGFPLFMSLLFASENNSYHPSLFTLISNQNLFFVGIIGAMILSPERFQFGGTTLTANYYGTEFLLTRAIDRPVYYRVKAAYLYLLVLMLPFLAVLQSLQEPDLVVDEYAKSTQQQCLASVPGSALLPAEHGKSPSPLISLPRGNVLVSEWKFLEFLTTALVLQLLLTVLYPFKYAKFIFWALVFGVIFAPLYFEIHNIAQNKTSLNEQIFFAFTGHQTLFWIATALLFILAQLWCERRFARFEQ